MGWVLLPKLLFLLHSSLLLCPAGVPSCSASCPLLTASPGSRQCWHSTGELLELVCTAGTASADSGARANKPDWKAHLMPHLGLVRLTVSSFLPRSCGRRECFLCLCIGICVNTTLTNCTQLPSKYIVHTPVLEEKFHDLPASL